MATKCKNKITPKINLEIGVEGGTASAKMKQLSNAKCCLIYSVNSTRQPLKGDVAWLMSPREPQGGPKRAPGLVWGLYVTIYVTNM